MLQDQQPSQLSEPLHRNHSNESDHSEHECHHGDLLKEEGLLYNPYKSPPTFEDAIKHGVANRVYRGMSGRKLSITEKEVCPCCGHALERELIPLGCELSELYHLGSGYALYLKLMKYCIYILGLIFITSGFYNLISDAAENDCTPPNQADSSQAYCIQDSISTLTLVNKRNNTGLLAAQLSLNIISMIIMILFFQYIRYQLRKTHIEADDDTVTPSDYTLKISNLDGSLNDQEIKDWIEGLQTLEQKITCKKINRTYKISDYVVLKKKRDQLEILIKHEHDDAKKIQYKQDIAAVSKELSELKKRGLIHTFTVFITLEKAVEVAYVIEIFEKSKGKGFRNYIKSFFKSSLVNINGKKVHIERAPEPTDILWENLGYTQEEKAKRRTGTRMGSGLLIAASFAVIVVINWVQDKIIDSSDPSSFLPQIISIGGSVLIFVINALLEVGIWTLTSREFHTSSTSYLTGVAEKLSVAQLINTGFTTILAKIVLDSSFSTANSFEDGFDSVNFYGQGGLIENMFYVFISNAFLTPALAFIDPAYRYKVYKRKQALKTKKYLEMTQQEAHQLFEEPEMDLAVKNAQLAKTMLLTAFFAPAVPFAIIFAILGLIANYWVDKYLLLRRNVHPIALKDELCVTMIRYIESMGVMFGLGNLFFIVTLQNSQGYHIYDVLPRALVYVTIGFAFLLVFLPMGYINQKVFPIVDNVTESQTYDEVRADFDTDYDIQNPITSREGLHEFLELVRQKKITAKKLKDNALKGAYVMLAKKRLRQIISKDEKNETQNEVEKEKFELLDEYAENFGRQSTKNLKRVETLKLSEVIALANEDDAENSKSVRKSGNESSKL